MSFNLSKAVDAMKRLNLREEPIRVTLWISTVLSVLVMPLAIDWLGGDISWKQALAGVLAAVIPLLSAGEMARTKVDSPATVEAKMAASVEAGEFSAQLEAGEDVD